jgi:outer membrane receptor protein involved in Fe transport
MKQQALLLTASVSGVVALTQPVVTHAQERQLEEIIVTAQKREERLVDVPMSIAVMSGEEIAQRGIQSVQDLSLSTPGLTMREDGPGSYTIFLRGLANQSGSGALVGLYLDEAPLSLDGYNQLSPVALDLDRIEVLKGPQGTLYGQGSAGGTIRYITSPTRLDAAEGRVDATITSVAHGDTGQQFSGVVNVPIVEGKLATRIAASYEEGAGWIDQPEAGIGNGNGTELTNVRAKLRWAPTEDFDAEAMVQVHQADTKLGLGYEDPDRTTAIGPDPAKVLLPKEFNFTVSSLLLNYDLGFADLVSATTYIDHDHQYPFTYIPREGNFSFGYVEGNDDRYVFAHQFSQELRLAHSGERFDWTLGAFYRDGATRSTVNYEYLYAENGDIATGGGTLYSDLFYHSEGSSESYSLFADGAYRFAERWTVGGGVRYFHDDQTGLIEYAPGTGEEQSETFDSVDPRAYVAFKFNDASNVYLSYARGFRSGGFNSAPFEPYDPEEISTYEIGTKGATGDGRLQFELAVYRTDYDDMVRRRLVLVDGGYLSESSNIGKVEVEGVEAGLAFRPVDPLTFTLTGAYIDSTITETDPADVVNLPGDRTDYTPRVSYGVGANYAFDWASRWPGYVRVEFNHRDEVTYIDRSSFLAEVLPQRSDELDLLDARVGATFGALDVEIFGLNLTDENAYIDPYQGWANANRTRPRMVGLKLGYQF